MLLTATRFSTVYKDHYIEFNEYDGEWTVIRWPIGKTRIPPHSEILTEKGWGYCMKTENISKRFDTLDHAIQAAS